MSFAHMSLRTFLVAVSIASCSLPAAEPTAALPADARSDASLAVPLSLEFESLVVVASSRDGGGVKSDARASGGKSYLYRSNAAGDFVTFRINLPAPGRHTVTVRARMATDRGTFQLAVADSPSGPWTNIDAPKDEYRPSLVYGSVEPYVNTPLFATSGTKYLRFMVTGKNAASSSFQLDLDRLTLEPTSCTALLDSPGVLENRTAMAIPGDTVCLRDGTYSDAVLRLSAVGTQAAPVTVAAEHPGGVVLSGASRLSVDGSWMVVSGLRFVGGQTPSGFSLLETRRDARSCSHCRLTDVAVVDVDAGASAETKWVALAGDHVRVDHCVFSGKRNPGAIMIVVRDTDAADDHLVDHNLFANRPDLGVNGGEALRVGTGARAASDSRTVVEYNLFEAMDGEAEIVSSKAGANIFRFNTFRRSAGQLTLRNGDRAVVEGNLFLATGAADAGGIRVTGTGHRIVNNYVEGVRTSKPTRGGIVLMAGDGASYRPVTETVIAHNTIVDSDRAIVWSAGDGTTAPANVTLANNVLAPTVGSAGVVGTFAGDGDELLGNLCSLGCPAAAGFRLADPLMTRGADGLLRPSASSPAVDAAVGVFVEGDMDGQARTPPLDAGADERLVLAATQAPLTRGEVGPVAYTVAVP